MSKPSEYEQKIAAINEGDFTSGLQESAGRYHLIAAWVAIVFDPLFGITDYLNFPDAWGQIFVMRIATSVLTLIAMYFHRIGKLSSYDFVLIPILLISLHGSYTYAIIGPENILGHNLNFLVMFMGAGLFAFWPLRYSLGVFSVPVIGSSFFIYFNQSFGFIDFAVNGGMVLATAAIFATLLIHARYRARLRELKAQMISKIQRDEIEDKSRIMADQAATLAEAKSKIETVNAQLMHQNEALEETINERTASLRKTSTERDQLVYRLSHDFRTPIVNIRAFLNLAEKRGGDAEQEALFGRMGQALDHFDNLVLDMSSFPVYARAEVLQDQVHVEALIRSVWDDFASVRQLEDVMTIDNQLAFPVVTDRDKFQVIVQAILSNALHFRREGAAAQLNISLLAQGQMIEIRFADNGPGIAPEIQPKVFEIFFRGSTRSKGVGLGLYLAQGVATQLGGNIALNSAHGQGTTVIVTIANLAKS